MSNNDLYEVKVLPGICGLLFFVNLSACVSDTITKDATFTCSPTSAVNFDNDIHPIFNTKCSFSGCHDGTRASIPTLSTLKDLQNNAQDIDFQLQNENMPPGGNAPLTKLESDKIRCWIANGARN